MSDSPTRVYKLQRAEILVCLAHHSISSAQKSAWFVREIPPTPPSEREFWKEGRVASSSPTR